MKKVLAFFLSAALFASATPVFAMTENYITRVEMVQEETQFTEDTAPQLVFRPSTDHTGSFKFMLTLEHAKWTYGDSGTISEGISYEKITDNMLTVSVDADVVDVKNDYIRIPLLTKLTAPGAATVSVDPMESLVSSGTYVFAQSGFEDSPIEFSIESAGSMGDKGTLGPITINDTSTLVMQKGEEFRLKLTNGFIFTSEGKIYSSGKFDGKASVHISPDSPSVMIVKMDADTGASTGKIILSDLQIAATEDSEYGKIDLTLTKNGGSGTIQVAEHERRSETEADTAKPQSTVQFTIGKQYYTVDGDMVYEMEAMPYIDDNGRTMLPLRAFANAIEIADEDILWSPSARTVTVRQGEKTVTVAIDSNLIEVNGVKSTMDTQAVIKDDYTYLPMRAMLNALGFDDEHIVWDAKNFTVTVAK